MSFNPIRSWEAADAKEEPVGAFEVSKFKRIVQVAFAVIYCLFSAGVVFGYAALKPVLIKEGVYSQYCEREEVMAMGGTCYEQEIRSVLSPIDLANRSWLIFVCVLLG